MGFSYRNLWIALERSGISKTELRKRTGMSTATLAKLSANQPVAMDVLGTICQELGCSLSDVVTYESEAKRENPWYRISQTGTYLVKLFFYRSDEESQAEYLYGFAAPFRLTEYGLEQWKLNPDEDPRCYTLDGYMTGENLWRFIALAVEGRMLGEMLEQLHIVVKAKKEGILNAVKASFLCNGKFVYRPPYILPPHSTCTAFTPHSKPLQSFDDTAMYCESLFGLQKKRLYSSQGYADAEKAGIVWRFLSGQLPLNGSLNEMSRLNNFEVFYTLDGAEQDGNGIQWKIISHENRETMKKIPEAFELTLDHTRVRGRYAVNVRLQNTGNPFSDTLHIMYCETEDAVLRLPLSESVSHIEIRVWKIKDDSSASELMIHEGASLIRQVHLSMRVQSGRTVIRDEWSRRMEQSGKSVEEEASFYSKEELSFGNRDTEAWLEEEEQVQRDFRDMLEMGTTAPDGKLFLNDSDKAAEFLAWLKKTLDGSDIHRVILVDPYIEAESVLKFIRCVGDVGVAYEIYTDSYAGGESQKNKKRIDMIREISEDLRIIIPPHFLVKTSAHPGNALHDRLLILVGESLNPKVFVLTNSLDGMAKKHASLVTQVNNRLARETFDYYLKLFESLQKEGKLETLCESDGRSARMPVCPKKEREELPFKPDPDHFISHLFTEPASALEALAHMPCAKREECLNYCLSQGRERMTELLVSVIDQCDLQEKPEGGERNLRHALALSQLLTREFSEELLDDAERLLCSNTEFNRYGKGWSLYFASEILWRIDPERYCNFLAELTENGNGYRTISSDRRFEVPAQMLSVLVFELEVYGLSEKSRDILLRAKLPLLRALGICKALDFPEEVRTARPAEGCAPPPDLIPQKICALDALESRMEKFTAMVYLAKSLQVILCRRNYNSPVIQKYIDQTGVEIASYLNQQKESEGIPETEVIYKYLQPLYMRNPEDICKIVKALWNTHTIAKEDAAEMLMWICLEKYRNGMSSPEEFYRADDILVSEKAIGYLAEIDVKALGKLRKQMDKMERFLAERLCKPFLKTQNYRLWKSSIDLYTCLICLEIKIANDYSEHGALNARAIAEYQKIASNFEETLEKYSEVYQFAQELLF